MVHAENESIGLLKPRDLATWMLIVANLIPLVGVLAFQWDVATILVIYWAENLVVGTYAILKIVFAHVKTPAAHLEKLLLVPFFLVHFGGFCAIHGLFILVFIHTVDGATVPDVFPDFDDWWGPLVFVGLLVNVVSEVWKSYGNLIIWPIAGLYLSHGISFIQNYLVRREFETSDPDKQMLAPYGRIVVMHMAILLAGVPVLMLGSPTPLLALLVTFKIVTDIFFHNASHRSGNAGTMKYLSDKFFRRPPQS